MPDDDGPGAEVGQGPVDLGLGRGLVLGGQPPEPKRAVRVVDEPGVERLAVLPGIAHAPLEELELGAHDLVDLADRPLGEGLGDAAVGIDDVVDLDDRVLLDEPIPAGLVEAQDIGAHGVRVLGGHDLPPEFGQAIVGVDVEAFDLGPLPVLGGERLEVLGLPLAAEILGQERDELLDGDVARIVEGDAGDVHLLVVAEEHVDHAAGGGRFLLEAHEEVEDLLGPGAPVHDVAELDEMGLAARPVEVVVDEADLRVGEDEDEAVVVAVEVGDGHDPVDARPFEGDVGGGGEPGQDGEGQKEEEERPAPPADLSAAGHRLLPPL